METSKQVKQCRIAYKRASSDVGQELFHQYQSWNNPKLRVCRDEGNMGNDTFFKLVYGNEGLYIRKTVLITTQSSPLFTEGNQCRNIT